MRTAVLIFLYFCFVDTSFIFQVVLSVLRNDVDASEKDWALYESELERVFNDVAEDNSLLDRKRVLSALLQASCYSFIIRVLQFMLFVLGLA